MLKKLRSVALLAMTVLAAATFTSCQKEGCTDPKANNYSADSKKDNGTCTYPIINTTPNKMSGDVKGEGGTVSKTWTFTNSKTSAGYDMSISATAGSFQLILKDSAGKTVLDKTLTAGSGPQSTDGVTATGAAGTWTCTVTLTQFKGTGDYSFL